VELRGREKRPELEILKIFEKKAPGVVLTEPLKCFFVEKF
jgi:hypothetical protein